MTHILEPRGDETHSQLSKTFTVFINVIEPLLIDRCILNIQRLVTN